MGEVSSTIMRNISETKPAHMLVFAAQIGTDAVQMNSIFVLKF